MVRIDIPATASRQAMQVAACIVGMTVLFTVQEVVRNVASGGPAQIGEAIAFNGVDWLAWAAMSPLVLAAARRSSLDGERPLAVSIATWMATAVVVCLGQGLLAAWALYAFHLVPVQALSILQSRGFGAFAVRWVVSTAALNLVLFLMLAGVVHAVLYREALRDRRLRQSDLEARLAQAELESLRMQLQPHFLFNALHTVSSLMLTDVASAHRVVAAIGDLLRWSIAHTAAQEVSLQQELDFADRYLEIQRARFRERLRLEWSMDPDCLESLVPSFVLQPLLENAVRHGLESSPTGVTIRVTASREADGRLLVLGVRDDAPPPRDSLSRKSYDRSAPRGIGLANIRSRLAQLYGDRHTFSAGRLGDGCFAVSMRIPFHVAG